MLVLFVGSPGEKDQARSLADSDYLHSTEAHRRQSEALSSVRFALFSGSDSLWIARRSFLSKAGLHLISKESSLLRTSLVLELYPVPIAMVLLASLIAAVTDVWKFKVYNLLTFPLLASGLMYHAFYGGLAGLAGSAVSAAAGFALMIMLYTIGGMGAGDVKFVTALGAWLGVPLTLYVLIAGCVATGVYAAVLLVAASSWRETFLNMQILWLRLSCLSRHLGSEDRVETEVKRPDRRRHSSPFRP